MHAVARKEIDKLETPWPAIAHCCSSDGNKEFKQKTKSYTKHVGTCQHHQRATFCYRVLV